MTENLKISVANGVMEICWNRPDKKNALTNDMYRGAAEALERASADKAVRCVVLTSEGDAFTAGNDLSVFAGAASGGEAPQGSRWIEAIARFDKPLVAGVKGVAVGVGTTMLLHCDLVYVAADAKLSTPFVNLALVPEAASSLLLPQRVGQAQAFAMFALGEVVSGTKAVEIGIANAALPAGEVIAAARAAAAEVAKRPLGALMATKKLMRDQDAMLAAIKAEGEIFAERLKTAEAAEAFAAFRERRAADFSKF
jgi:enoyl-CoA hydratase/carnithine racemase